MPTQEDINDLKSKIDGIKRRLEGTDISLVFNKTQLMLPIFIACRLHKKLFFDIKRDMVRGQLERELRTLERDLLRMQQELQLSEDTCLVKDEMKKLKKMVRFFVIIVLKYSVYY